MPAFVTLASHDIVLQAHSSLVKVVQAHAGPNLSCMQIKAIDAVIQHKAYKWGGKQNDVEDS